MKCPQFDKDLTNEQATSDSEVSGFLDISYECTDCKITIYTYKVEKGISE